MRLKSLEIFGFKSFPEKTVITFGRGITAILGPNGCGKSNIVDAVKWVLGERSAKNLRGGEMLDVVFSGCSSRSASGIAEVTLNFDNSDHTLKTAYEEVAVRRRLTRARESSYFINNTPCHLRDIRDLFMNTGVGNSAYSMIEQGRVEALLSAKPVERRIIFEEAAGISRFKAERKITLARLDRTEQILARAGDRLEEKERRIRKVSSQAANARRHRKLSGERDQVRAHLYRRQRAAQIRLGEGVQARREALKSELDAVENGLAALNLKFTRLAGREAELSANHGAVAKAAAENQEARAAIQLARADAKNRVEALANDIARGNERRSELTARLERLTAQEAGAAAGWLAANARAEELESRHGDQDALRQDLLRRAGEAESLVTGIRNRLIDLNRRRQELFGAAAGLEAAEQSGAAWLAEFAERLSRIRREGEAAARDADQVAEEYRRAAEGFGAAADQLESLRGKSRELAAGLQQLQAGERADEAEKAGLASRRATLEDLEKNLAGAYDGVRNVILAARRGEDGCRGVIGMAGDLLTVPENLALALETILGSSAQDVVTETARDAQSAIEYLKRDRLGRATFLPLDRIQPRRRLSGGLVRLPGVIGEAVDQVSFDRRYAAVMEHLLAGVLIVDNLDLARELAGREARGVKIVTLDGDVINPSGAMTGGRGKATARGGLVQRKAELEALAAKLAECERRLAEKGRRRDEIVAAQRDVAARIALAEKDVAEIGRSEAGLKQNLAARLGERDRLFREAAEAEAGLQDLAGGGESRRGELEGVKLELAGLEAEMAGLEVETAAGTEEQRRSREAVDSLGQEFAVLSGERSEAVAKARELESRQRELAADIAAVREELERPGLSAEQAGREMLAWRERLAGLEGREAELLRVRDEQSAVNAEIAEGLERLRSDVEEARREERDGQTQATRLRDGLAQLDRQETEIRLRLEHILAKAREELDLRPEDLEGPPRAETHEETPRPDPGAEWADLPDEGLQAMLEELSQKIRNIGNVNFEAIDELAELEAGAEFLRVQKEEQEEAVAVIRAAIADLNSKSSALFQSTFEAVRANFQQIFASLFGGGRADLLLEEPTEPGADPLDAGIEIRAQPPGKEPKSISLLSGGEKALCAVALLFALFRSKPSPFCVLDEVDGPLDEANIERFMRQIRAFTADTQFIVITHSQLTMGMTDAIWGVTQKVAGISNVHSLKFDDMEKISQERPSDPGPRREGRLPDQESGGETSFAETSEALGDRLLAPA